MIDAHADSFFAIGSTHEVCQDYARSGTLRDNNIQFAVISDGCSSSPDTDFGARILTVNAIECLTWDKEFTGKEVIQCARKSTNLPVSQRCLDATLLMAYYDDGLLTIRASGDGVIIFIYADGRVRYMDFEFLKGAPAYLSYLLSPDRQHQYITEFGGEYHLKDYELQTGEVRDISLYKKALDQRDLLCQMHYAGGGGLEAIMVCSDGVHSFTDGNDPIPTKEVIAKIADIRNYKGNFVKRNMKFFLQRECKKLGWVHTDDLSVAGIHMPQREAKPEDRDQDKPKVNYDSLY